MRRWAAGGAAEPGLILTDTIVAISTPPGTGGLGVVRLSGAQARAIAAGILRFPKPPEWTPWTAALAELPDAAGHTVDQVVATFFAQPRSYTAEDLVEISCHGSPVVLRFAVERALEAGARLAEPGEFTLRAFLNGRIDLPRAEAVRDLIEATTLYQARIAAQQAEGWVSRRIAPLKEQLVELTALLEAGIDFAEDDIDVMAAERVAEKIAEVRAPLVELERSFAYGRVVREGFRLAIVGRPNAGKSSLFNRLVERDRAIVTAAPGTTRDTVSERVSMEGIPVELIDTAGLREGADEAERMGVARTREAMAEADVVLLVVDATVGISQEDRAVLELGASGGSSVLVAWNKCDLVPQVQGSRFEVREQVPGVREVQTILTSALTGEGIEELRAAIVAAVAGGEGGLREAAMLTNLRQHQAVEQALGGLASARLAVDAAIPHEMLLLDLYESLRGLDTLTGATTSEDVLRLIFSSFCIGK